PVDGVGVGLDHLAARPQLAQEHAVIEVPAMGLAHRVVEVLHIDEYGESFHGVLRLLAPLCAGGSFVRRTTSFLSAVTPKPRLRLPSAAEGFVPTPAWATVAPPLFAVRIDERCKHPAR